MWVYYSVKYVFKKIKLHQNVFGGRLQLWPSGGTFRQHATVEGRT